MAGKRPGLRNENKSGPQTEGEPRAKSESPDHLSSPGSGGGGSPKTSVGQSYATAAMMAPVSPAQPETTKAKKSTGGTEKAAKKGKANGSGAAEETSVDNDSTASETKWLASYEALKTTVTFCRKPLPSTIIEKFHEHGISVPEFAIGVDIVESIMHGSAESITAEILDEYTETLFRQYAEFIAEASTKASEGQSKPAETKKQAQERDWERMPTSNATALNAQFRAPSDADMKLNELAARRAHKLSSVKSIASDGMIPLAERLIASLVNNDHSAVQQCKVGLASSAADGLSIVPSDVVGPLDTCAIDGNGTRARIFSFADNSDEEVDGSSSFENSSDLGVRPRSPGKKSHTKEDIEASATALVKRAVDALNGGYKEDALPQETFKTEMVTVSGKPCHVIRVTPGVYVRLCERSVANRRIRDAVMKALRLLLEKRNGLDPVSRSKLQAVLTEHERIDSMTAEDQAPFMRALPVDEEPSMLSVAASQTAPGLNIGVNIIEEIHDILFDHENAQGIQIVCRFMERVVVGMRSDGTYDPIRTSWNKILTQSERLSKNSPLGLPWTLYGFMVDDDGMPQLLSKDNLAKMLIVHSSLKLSRQPGYNRLQEMYPPSSLNAEVVAKLGEKELMELIAFAEKEVEPELRRTQKPQRQAESAVSEKKPVYNNLGGGAAFVATAEQAPFAPQRKASHGPRGNFLSDYSFWAGIGLRVLENSTNVVEATTTVAKQLHEHSGGTLFSSINPTGLVLRPGTTWQDNSYFDNKTTAGIRYLKDTIGISDNTYFSLVPGTTDLQRLRNKLAKTTLQINTCKAADAQQASKQAHKAAAGKGGMGKGAPNWKNKGKGGKGTPKATAAAATMYDNDGDGGGYGGGDSDYGSGGGSSGSKCAAN